MVPLVTEFGIYLATNRRRSVHTVRAYSMSAERLVVFLSDHWGSAVPRARLADLTTADLRAFLAARVPGDFDGTLRQVVRMRVEWALREGNALLPETVALWNAVR